MGRLIKKSRLKRRGSLFTITAQGTIELYHATTAQIFMQIANSGSIQPGGQTGITSNGVPTADGAAPSGMEDAIYLCDEHGKDFYLEKTPKESNMLDSTIPDFGVAFTINVNTDSLDADYDDLVGAENKDKLDEYFESNKEMYEDETAPHWKKSLEDIGQVIHYGPIGTDQIKSVQLDFSTFVAGGSGIDIDDFDDILDELGIDAGGVTLGFGESVVAVKNIFDTVRNGGLQKAGSR
jgi:hypothetical protein